MNIDLATDCQSNCIFCHKQFISGYKNFEEIIRNLKSVNDNVVYLGGQEPMNFQDLDKLVTWLKQKNHQIKIVIKSSGFFKKRFDLNFFKEIDKIELPLYSSVPEKHNKIMGNNQAWSSLMNILDFICGNKLNKKVLFHTVSLKENYYEIKEIYDLAQAKLGDLDYFKVLYPKGNIEDAAFKNINVKQDVVVKKLIGDFNPTVLKEKIELINFMPFKQQELFRGVY